MNTANDNSRAIAAILEHLEYTLDHAVKRAIEEDNPIAVLRYLNLEVAGHGCLLDKYLTEYVELAVTQVAVNVLGAILAYELLKPEHVLDLNRMITGGMEGITEASRYTLLNYTCHYIGGNACLKIATLLLEAGAHPNIPDCSGYTPLHHAALNKDRNLIQRLLEHQANPNMLTDSNVSCFEWLLEDLIEDLSDPDAERPGKEIEDSVLACVPPFLEHHAQTPRHMYNHAEELGFTRVLTRLNETKTYPTHIAASYMSKEAMVQHLKDTSFEYFELLDTHRNKPSDIARKYGQEDIIIDMLENYEAVYNRRLLLEKNYTHAGAGLPAPIEIQRVKIASFLTPQEFGFFTVTTNMHMHPADRHVEDIEHQAMLQPNI